MSLTHTTARKNALVGNETAAIDAGLGAGTDPDRTGKTEGAIKIYSGTAPGANNAATGSLLCIIEFQNPSFGAAAGGVATLNGTPLTGSITTSGNAGYFRIVDRNGNVIEEGAVGTSGSDLNISGSVTLTSGGTVTINSGSITGPA